ncbi:MAG: universal stress protein [Gammaproteobacteria bacterium]|nr:universal stress protein [Gammaproteobacteria bacterium]MCW8841598.1 universal stress protein [Gammaproteobacteria bacterium]MCW8957518.1 universal stress protein [Gammaproteobacteria bacterium]MCW8973108.1 universal stress protein [Gammaproteobacteria bacterium]MCW8993105.1 universal stress protein [Gammaproteobacteria bacterium]
MFKKIMVPVDLAHLKALDKALAVAADMARHYHAALCYVGVTISQPSSVAHNPQEYETKLKAFAAEHAPDNGHPPETAVYVSHDPVADLDEILLQAIKEQEADLVVMGTHLPHHIDAIMPANGSKVAAHSSVSVFLVRP